MVSAELIFRQGQIKTETITGGERTQLGEHPQHVVRFTHQLTGTETAALPVCEAAGLERMWFRAAEKLSTYER